MANKTKYIYNYPENKKYKKYLFSGDITRIAEKAGCAETTLREILKGRRKLQAYQKDAIIEVIRENQQSLQKVL